MNITREITEYLLIQGTEPITICRHPTVVERVLTSFFCQGPNDCLMSVMHLFLSLAEAEAAKKELATMVRVRTALSYGYRQRLLWTEGCKSFDLYTGYGSKQRLCTPDGPTGLRIFQSYRLWCTTRGDSVMFLNPRVEPEAIPATEIEHIRVALPFMQFVTRVELALKDGSRRKIASAMNISPLDMALDPMSYAEVDGDMVWARRIAGQLADVLGVECLIQDPRTNKFLTRSQLTQAQSISD